MSGLEAELAQARALEVDALADAIESIGFECTRCGACCRGHGDDHTATVFPDEVRGIASGGADAGERDTGTGEDGASEGDAEEGGDVYDWRDVARPMPFGLSTAAGEDASGETFEWALQTDACGDCTFYDDGEEASDGTCTVYDDRPLICRTYPFSVERGGSEPMGEVVDSEGMVRAHECEGLGRDIDREEAEELARTLKDRAVREVEELIAVRDNYELVETGPGEVVVHDSEGAKRPDGTPYR